MVECHFAHGGMEMLFPLYPPVFICTISAPLYPPCLCGKKVFVGNLRLFVPIDHLSFLFCAAAKKHTEVPSSCLD